ncbi:MAG: ABC-type polysaccharide/polyol phosphate transport system ATPase subunit [Patiriisocius sp.]
MVSGSVHIKNSGLFSPYFAQGKQYVIYLELKQKHTLDKRPRKDVSFHLSRGETVALLGAN